ncbi:PTS system mannose/fructose/sorbose family transporter subunit IID, partial [uncultured Holdemania sp.]|uniref:PTS system mannose/fructose/sorbose family transporter subunit IID n=1 Tax=uncultured Holdemania sp. TaxID=527664 RepID=UPI0025F35DF2
AGAGISLAQQGNVLGPILFLILFNVPHLVLRYYCTIWGYVLGSKFIQTSYENGLIHHMTKLATVIGLTTVGAMIATMVSLNVGLTVQIGEMELVVQEIFDQIMPNLLPLSLTMAVFYAIRKGIKVNTLIIAIFVIGLLGTFIGLL